MQSLSGGTDSLAGETMMPASSSELSGGESLAGMNMVTAGTVGGAEITECIPETCDALDNDCDGQVDEGIVCQCTEDNSCYAGSATTRGIGECRDGRRECDRNGEQWQECIGSVGPTPELCDQLDNDCDGRVDEDTDPSCGCETVSNETCDGVDNDCDGRIDEEIVRPCLCDPNVERMQVCSNGEWIGCEDNSGMTMQLGTTIINLPALTPSCPFGVEDNLEATGAVVSARVEQTAVLDIPQGGKLCGFSLSASNEDFYFDDELMLLLNDIPLIGSVNFASHFESVDGLPRYDWSRIRGLSTTDLGEATCIEGATDCLIPGTQSNGRLSIAFDNLTNNRLSTTGTDGQHIFKIVVVGDNDHDLDCAHSGLDLEVNFSYLAR